MDGYKVWYSATPFKLKRKPQPARKCVVFCSIYRRLLSTGRLFLSHIMIRSVFLLGFVLYHCGLALISFDIDSSLELVPYPYHTGENGQMPISKKNPVFCLIFQTN